MKLIHDKYRKKHGGWARIYAITCERCGSMLCRYQKDGPGELRRMYVDRILEPVIVWKKDKKLTCGSCGKWLGLGAVFQREKRKCIILFHDVVRKKIVKR